MPQFPNGSRAFACDSNQVELPECGESIEVIEEPDGSKTHISTVYIASKKGEEFQVAYHIKPEGHATHALVVIKVDDQDVDRFSVTHFNRTSYCKGWSDAYTTQHMTFGAIDVDDSDEAEKDAKGKQVLTSYVEVLFHNAVIMSRSAPRPQTGVAKIAAPVHPDSKAALCGVQVKPGQKSFNPAPKMTTGYSLGKVPYATKYIARFLYRKEAMLIAQEIMPDPNAGKRKNRADSDNNDGFDFEAGPKNKKKLKAKEEPAGVKKEGQSSQSAIEIDAAPKNQKVFMDFTGGADSDDDD